MMVAPLRDRADADGALRAALYELLWGRERSVLPTAVDRAYELIWQGLVLGHHFPGQRLADGALAAQLGLSRTPVRQALHRLAQDGLVHSEPRRGFWVRRLAAADVQEIYDLRAALEPLALRLAAPRLDPRQLHDQLAEIAAVRSRLDDQPLTSFLRSDWRLHHLLIQVSGNERLIRMLAALRTEMSLLQVPDSQVPCRLETALDDHERIIRALLAGENDLAAQLLLEHITRSKQRVLDDLFSIT